MYDLFLEENIDFLPTLKGGFFINCFMSDDKVYLTSEALSAFKSEYEDLLKFKRPEAVNRVSETRVPGDLSENNEHTQAKQDLAFIDGRLSELDEIFSKTELIDEGHKNCQEVGLGCKVLIKVNNQKHTFHLVGEWEADPVSKKISSDSPLGQALIGKKVGERVEVEAPAGKIVYKILKID